MSSDLDDARATGERLPGAIPAIACSMRLAFQARPREVVISLVLTVLAMAPDVVFAVALKVSVDAVVASDRGALWLGLCLIVVTVCGGWTLGVASQRVNRVLQLKVAVALERRVAELMSSVPSLRHQEQPALLDRLATLRDAVGQLGNIYSSIFVMLGAIARLVFIVSLLVIVHPAMVLLFAFALPVIWLSSVGTAQWRAAEESHASNKRQAKHLYDLGMSAATAKELRLAAGTNALPDLRRDAWRRWYRATNRARWRAGWWEATGWAIFSAGYAGAVLLVLTVIPVSAGDVVLLVAAGGRLAQYVNQAVGQMTFLRMWIETAKRLLWLEHYRREQSVSGTGRAPEELESGIVAERLTFGYGESDEPVLRDVSFNLPAGSTVALVGENGAGKTTLLKLLSRFYEAGDGEIRVDGTPLDRFDPSEWRGRLSAAYQDFCKFEFTVGESIGVGDLGSIDVPERIMRAATDARADGDIRALPAGLSTRLGASWPGGHDLSHGQWQRIAVARCRMRQRPTVVMLDEPTAALDAETEAELFERFASQAGEVRERGGIVVFVSHRMSTARIADIVLVLADGRIVESGSHAELMADGRTYRELYDLQARGYR